MAIPRPTSVTIESSTPIQAPSQAEHGLGASCFLPHNLEAIGEAGEDLLCILERLCGKQHAIPDHMELVKRGDDPRWATSRLPFNCASRTPRCFIERRKSANLATYPRYVKLVYSCRLFSRSTSRFQLTMDRSV